MEYLPKTLEDVRKMINTTNNLRQKLEEQEKLLLLDERNKKVIELEEDEYIITYEIEVVNEKSKKIENEIQKLNEEKLKLLNKLNKIRQELSNLQTQKQKDSTYKKIDNIEKKTNP